MADLFTRDLAALDERSRQPLRSMSATRARVLSTPLETSKMRFFKNRPLLAALIVAALVGVASGGAYVVKHTLLSIDTTKSAPEIEQDVESQLAQEGVTAHVTADKPSENQLELTISSTDENLPDKLRDMGAIVVSPDGSSAQIGPSQPLRIEIDDQADLDDAQTKRLTDAFGTRATLEALTSADPATALTKVLVAAGFTDVEVTASGDDLVVHVKSPPAP